VSLCNAEETKTPIKKRAKAFLGRPIQSKSDFLPINKQASVMVNESSGKHDRDSGDSPGPGVL
jgi:hypothetical protein